MCEYIYAGTIYCAYPFTIRYSNSNSNRATHHSSLLGEHTYIQQAYIDSVRNQFSGFWLLLYIELWCAQLPTDHPTGTPTTEPTLVRLHPINDSTIGMQVVAARMYDRVDLSVHLCYGVVNMLRRDRLLPLALHRRQAQPRRQATRPPIVQPR
jgi:hypothetical protein